MKTILTYLALAAMPISASARFHCRPVVVHHAPFVHKVQVVEKVHVIKEIPVAVFAPIAAYGAVYIPPAAIPAVPVQPAPPPPPQPPAVNVGAVETLLREVLAEQRRQGARLDALERKVGGEPAPRPEEKRPGPFDARPPAPALAVDAHAVITARCASCHEKAVAMEKGGGLALLEAGALRKLTDRQAAKVVSEVIAQTMPPEDHPRLSVAERDSIVKHYRKD